MTIAGYLDICSWRFALALTETTRRKAEPVE